MVSIAERQRIRRVREGCLSSRVVLNCPINGYCLLAMSVWLSHGRLKRYAPIVRSVQQARVVHSERFRFRIHRLNKGL